MQKVAYCLEYIGPKIINASGDESFMIRPECYISNPYISFDDGRGSKFNKDFWEIYTKEEVNQIKSDGGILCPSYYINGEKDIFIPISNIRLHRITIITEIKDEIVNF